MVEFEQEEPIELEFSTETINRIANMKNGETLTIESSGRKLTVSKEKDIVSIEFTELCLIEIDGSDFDVSDRYDWRD
jgi:hypothetical protein